eukprot:6242582-Pyramimonas_sp.AAC.1
MKTKYDTDVKRKKPVFTFLNVDLDQASLHAAVSPSDATTHSSYCTLSLSLVETELLRSQEVHSSPRRRYPSRTTRYFLPLVFALASDLLRLFTMSLLWCTAGGPASQ